MHKQQLARIGVLLNILLFLAKFAIGLRTGSAAVLSDALNSLLDVFAYTAIHVGVKLQEKAPDENHPFGHRRAEPLAGLVIAIFAALLGAAILKESGLDFFHSHKPIQRDALAILVMVGAILTKLALAGAYWREARRSDSFAMRAGAVDSRNDVLASVLALSGLVLGSFWDKIAGVAIGGWILFSGIRMSLDSVGYLMGKVPKESVLDKIRQVTLRVPGVIDFNDLRAHFVGDRVHVEIHIEVDDTLPLRQAHEISIAVRYGLQDLPEIDRAFIHIDPIQAGDGEKRRETVVVTNTSPTR